MKIELALQRAIEFGHDWIVVTIDASAGAEAPNTGENNGTQYRPCHPGTDWLQGGGLAARWSLLLILVQLEISQGRRYARQSVDRATLARAWLGNEVATRIPRSGERSYERWARA